MNNIKEKIINILGKPKYVISITLLVAIIAGFFVYAFVGYAPKNISGNTSNLSVLVGNENIDLAFPKTGRVNMVNVKSGDVVKKGQILASLDFADARGALEIAKANYQKLINGATNADIDVAKAQAKTAQINLDTVTKQQNLAVELAYRNLLNSTLEAVPSIDLDNYTPPIISGNYILDKEGDLNISVSYATGNSNFYATGVAGNVNGIVNYITPQPIGNTGLYIKFPTNISTNVSTWVIHLPNQKAANYITNYNAYQSALEAHDRLINVAQATLDQANSVLLLKISKARPEDVAVATGALTAAEGAYNNNFIYAPADGTINVVNIGVGEIATANQRVISMTTNQK